MLTVIFTQILVCFLYGTIFVLLKDEDDEEEGAVGGASTSANGFSGPCDVYEGENLVPMVKTVRIFSSLDL